MTPSVTALIRELGGASQVASACGVKRSAVTMWGTRGDIPGEHVLTLWCMALERGVPWAPPGGERLVALLRGAPAPGGAAGDSFAKAA